MTEDLETNDLHLGFVALTDCAVMVAAQEKGFFHRQGLRVHLSREPSWANIRDKVALGLLDGAQMLAPMPLAMQLGVDGGQEGEPQPMVTALTLDLNGNAITLSKELFVKLQAMNPRVGSDPLVAATTIGEKAKQRAARGERPLTFAVVAPFSTHGYELRYWLALGGVHPDRDVRIVVVPPVYMCDALSSGDIDGFCVGEPWNQEAVALGIGRVVVTKYDLWNNAQEKVFAVTRSWADKHPRTHQALLRALLEAAAWSDRTENRFELASLVASPAYVNAPLDVVRMSMLGRYRYDENEGLLAFDDFHVFHRYAANFPWRSHAVWFLTQMVRWGQLPETVDFHATARAVYQPQLYREAADAVGMYYPTTDWKIEGIHPTSWPLYQATHPITMGPDMFLDGKIFDAMDPQTYLESMAVHSRAKPLAP